MILSQSAGLPFLLNALVYILLLEAVMASLVKFTKCAMFVGETPILRRRHILYSWGVTSRNPRRLESKFSYDWLMRFWISFQSSSTKRKVCSSMAVMSHLYMCDSLICCSSLASLSKGLYSFFSLSNLYLSNFNSNIFLFCLMVLIFR